MFVVFKLSCPNVSCRSHRTMCRTSPTFYLVSRGTCELVGLRLLAWNHNRQMRCFDLLQGPSMVIISRHLFAWLPSTGPSHSERRRKLGLVVSGQGGRARRAGKHRLLLSSSKPAIKSGSGTWSPAQEPGCVNRRWEGLRPGFALVLANKHINSKVDKRVGCGGRRRGSSSEGAAVAKV